MNSYQVIIVADWKGNYTIKGGIVMSEDKARTRLGACVKYEFMLFCIKKILKKEKA